MAEEIEDLVEFARRWMSEKEIEPGEDWDPVLVVRHDDSIETAELPGQLANSNDGKALLTAVAIRVVQAVKATEACLGLSAWMVKTDDDTEFNAAHPVSADPRRVEALVLCCWLESGDETWLAAVLRDADDRPTLVEWERLAGVESRFDPIGKILARNRRHRDESGPW